MWEFFPRPIKQTLDLYNLKQSCKSLFEVGQDDLVYKTVSMEKVPDVAWTKLSKGADFFVQRCQESENPEALFRLGMIEYFGHGQVKEGHTLLARVAYLGYPAASYVLGIVLICTATDNQTILQGVELLKNALRLKKLSRERTESIIRQMWLKNYIDIPQRSLCSNPNCSKVNNKDLMDDEEEVGDCDACKCDEELQLFCNKMLRGL
ncbi:hypothetical protein AQUCO_00500293v1 [Aquilegia coerulea]|uniref:At2g35280-like TPR domain-containing protein n=1 Tax=Aquilegia coerulea TaxID=218851 RepID=A0A2G5ER93_AQUCA|nr:hypothetical protein AQUCO_00500293v1 [Aquilegia coerulea]